MTTYDYRTGSTGPGTDDQGGTAGQAREAAQTAADEGRHVAETAKDEARSVAADARSEAQDLLGQARSQVEDQSRSQLDNLVGTLQGFADDLERMARGEGAGSGLAHDVVQQVGDRARGLTSQLQGREPSELLDQARDFARRRPGTFLVGALAAGVVAGRLARGAKDAHGSGSGATGTSTPGSTPGSGPGSTPSTGPVPSPMGGTAAADPLAGTGAPPAPPAYPEGTPSSTTQSSSGQWGTP